MAKKVIYTKNEIIGKAYEMMKAEGLNQVTARNLAKKLNTSPAPIYGHFDSMDILKDELIKKAKDQFLSYVTISYTDKAFLNAGMGFVIFAREEKELFNSIFLTNNSYRDIISEFRSLMFKEAEKDIRFIGVENEKKEWLFDKCWTYSHGLATLISKGMNKNNSDKCIEENLLDLTVFFDYVFGVKEEK